MKLYYSPGACSLAPHIALVRSRRSRTRRRVDLKTHTLADGTDYYTINPKGYVPLLELDDGDAPLRSRGDPAVHRRPQARHARARRSARWSAIALMEWLNFIATEVHKQFAPLWYPTTPDATKEAQRAKLATRFDLIAKTLAAQPYLTGETFTVADAYLFTIVNWAPTLKIDLAPLARAAAVPGARRRAADGARGARRRRARQGARAPCRLTT